MYTCTYQLDAQSRLPLISSFLLIPPHLQPKAASCTGILRPRMPYTPFSFFPPHAVFQARFRLIRLPVVRKPLSPIAPRHSIDNWPNVARPSFRKSFCRASSPSCLFSSCSTKNATCSTSRGFNVGGSIAESSTASQFSEWELNGGLGFNLVCCVRSQLVVHV